MCVCVYCTYREVVLQALFAFCLESWEFALFTREHNGYWYHWQAWDGRENEIFKRRMNRLWIDMTLDGILGNQELENENDSLKSIPP